MFCQIVLAILGCSRSADCFPLPRTANPSLGDSGTTRDTMASGRRLPFRQGREDAPHR
jgi:hypothetical protein